MISNTISSLLGVAIVTVAANSCDSILRMPGLFLQPSSANKYRLVGFKKYSFWFLKSMYSYHRWITRRRRPCPSFIAYLYTDKTIEDCTGAEEAGVEVVSKVDRISYTEKTVYDISSGWLSQTEQDTWRWLPELCTAKTTWHKKQIRH